ncbi:Gfo/Idh/MocA family oxidoreductase [Flavisolibacter ginsengisoli]|jgi:predicted dehydrogenase|uniref:Predicted dehydrogenase n=1 Tax=Flavisolibacter ginsengisoli DSM 18119 TaxID=1121884 RepID=A0A1M5C082_9BACT|nr:Gfo/Idh/MocA family oxidoreductase [Flavisolibacter ginsengisoli]SHF48017.1 Predicted dehydrogenase [Flavisolibacter ginsengisoli DSM 18119]
MNPIRTAILSYGMSGKLFHAPFLHVHPGFELCGVWERTKNEAIEKYPEIVTFRSLEELLSDNSIELVIVNTPNITHFEYARQALLAGKHVIVEKPFTVTADEAEQLIILANEKKKLLSVYHNRRFDSDYKTIKKVLNEGIIGHINEAEFHFDRFRNELSPKTHKEVAVKGTGALYDLGSHLIDQALQLFGIPEAVFADIRMIRTNSQVDDYFELLLYYNDKRVRLKANYLVREPLPGYIIHGSKGSFIKQRTDVQEKALLQNILPESPGWGVEPGTEKGLLHTEINGKVVREQVASLTGNYMEYYNSIYDALRNNKDAPVAPLDGLQVIRVIEAAFESNAKRSVVPLT